MKKSYSLLIILLIGIFFIQHRYVHFPDKKTEIIVTDWDALGYYIYLPSILTYNDYKDLKWIDSIDKKYHVSGGHLYQAGKASNGNYVFKYLGGVSLLQLPFYLIANNLAKIYDYPQDGFSYPYQLGVIIGAFFYAFLGILILRKVLLYYFDDFVAAVCILIICTATNLPQYAAIDSGMSHIYIFPLYSLILLFTIKWHKKPSITSAIMIGVTIGLATICRPTEAVMLFIPLLWNTHNKTASAEKWGFIKTNYSHTIAVVIGGLIGILPQLIYWKSATNKWIYDVGSAWDFLTPHLRVLFGWEKGWFIYTPVTIVFIVGLFFISKYNFKKSVIWFCILNIYIIIAWRDWQYGGSYSTRALVQSYPVFALSLAGFIEYIQSKKWRWTFYIPILYFIGLNVFQLYQYSDNILHFKDMNRKYYGAIYLDKDPTPIDMSLLDRNDVLHNLDKFVSTTVYSKYNEASISFNGNKTEMLYSSNLNTQKTNEQWLIVKTLISVDNGFWDSYLNIEIQKLDSTIRAKTRLFSPVSKDGAWNEYELHMHIPEYFYNGEASVFVSREIPETFSGKIKNLEVKLLAK